MSGLLFFLIAGLGAASARAGSEFATDRGWLHFNGYSHHFAADDANDRLLGIGYPFVETRGTRLKVRAYYIPPVRRASDEQLAIQLVWALRR